jgi:F-box protein 9
MSTLNTDAEKEHELEEFRNTWRQEVKQKHIHDTEPGASSSKDKETLQHKKGEEETFADLIEQTESLTTKEEAVPVTAMDYYVVAVDDERQGKLGKGMNCLTHTKNAFNKLMDFF